MDSMTFSITEIKNKAVHTPYHFEGRANVSGLETDETNDIRKIGTVDVKGFVTVDGKELLFAFSVTGNMILPCARTLVDVPYDFSFDVTEVFSTAAYLEEEEVENDVHAVTEELLDLTPYIKENIILETPYRVFSDEEALEGGTGWSFQQEDEHQEQEEEKIDPRMAKLLQLLDKDHENKE